MIQNLNCLNQHLLFLIQIYCQVMEESPLSNRNKAEKDRKHTCVEEKEDYYQEGIILGELPRPINGDLLKEILHRSVGALTFLNKYKQLRAGSGVLISRDTVLTAAHNIFDRKDGCENQDFKFYIGADGVAEEYHEFQAWRYPEEFTCLSQNKLKFDYAIMKLKKQIQFDRYMPLSLACQDCLRGNKAIMIQIYGFPATYPRGHPDHRRPFKDNYMPLNPPDKYGKNFILNQYGLAQQNRIYLIDASQLKICYSISTLPGHSGSPVVVNNKIIAVHVGDKSNFNLGRIIDSNFIYNMWKWREELNTVPFQLDHDNVCPHDKETLEKMQYKLVLGKRSLEVIDLREYTNLMELYLQDNNVQQIDLSHCSRLTILILSRNHLHTIDLSSNIHLISLQAQSNKLQEIDVSANINLSTLSLSSNQLHEIDLSTNIHLAWLDLYSNHIQEVDVRLNIQLTRLWLFNNKISEIDLTKNTKMEWLHLHKNRLTHVYIWIAEKVKELRYKKPPFFNLSDQQSAACQVLLKCEAQSKQKAAQISEEWRSRYQVGSKHNEHNCQYMFKVA